MSSDNTMKTSLTTSKRNTEYNKWRKPPSNLNKTQKNGTAHAVTDGVKNKVRLVAMPHGTLQIPASNTASWK